MTEDLQKLLDRAREHEMSADEAREQRRSFVYGNTHIENSRITRGLVDRIDESREKRQ